ncbi:MAG: RHS repeat-associated core domain-containing protein, partial [Actinomycetota bacterium]|nr:RHS repeat-associated core domain-containing protein [Actinomycetota bacterium]
IRPRVRIRPVSSNDELGRRTSAASLAGTTTYDWNALGQLANVGSTGVTATYSYGASGMRERKVVVRPGSTKTTDSFWIGEQLVSEKDSDGRVYTYVYGPGGTPLELVVTSGATSVSYAYVTDALGSVVGLADASGRWVATYRYDPWGRVVEEGDWNSSGLAARQPLRYRGYYHDSETGMYYLPARYYDPAVARFISVDPAPPKAGSPVSLNAYVYAGDSPIMFLDPDGRDILLGNYYPGDKDMYEPDIVQHDAAPGGKGFAPSPGRTGSAGTRSSHAPSSSGQRERQAAEARLARVSFRSPDAIAGNSASAGPDRWDSLDSKGKAGVGIVMAAGVGGAGTLLTASGYLVGSIVVGACAISVSGAVLLAGVFIVGSFACLWSVHKMAEMIMPNRLDAAKERFR